MILLHESSAPAYSIFNQNNWGSESKKVINLCAINYGLLIYTSKKINNIFKNTHALCSSRQNLLESQWKKSKWELSKCNYYVDVPQLHLSIHSFLSSVKTFLDVIVQLIDTEGIVSTRIHGFHRKGTTIGGQLIKILNNNAVNIYKDKAKVLRDLIIKHKDHWIDDAVNSRDSLIHPDNFSKIMFELVLSEEKGNLIFREVLKPSFNGVAFDKYALSMLASVETFSKEIIKCLKNS